MRVSSRIPSGCSTALMPCAGAEGFLVMARRRAEALGLPYVRVRSTCERHNAFPTIRYKCAAAGCWSASICTGRRRRARRHRLRANLRRLSGHVGHSARGPRLLSEGRRRGVHPPQFLYRGREFSDQHMRRAAFGRTGRLCSGLPWSRRDIRQLTGRNLAHPVADARFGIAVGFGMITYDRGLCSGAAILSRADA